MEKKESYSMKLHRVLILGLALMAVMGITTGQARAELISITLSVTGSGSTIDADLFSTPGSTTYNLNPGADTTALNAALHGAGSAYTFVTLSGSSNFPGLSQGQLVLNGLVETGISGSGTNTGLTITETESLFTAPTGPSGDLKSSQSANFTNQPVPASGTHNQSAYSMFNTTSTPTYFVDSTTTSPNQGLNTGPVSAPLKPVPTLYTLTNSLTLGLSIGTPSAPISDTFGVAATVTAIPEPSSLLTMLGGLPLPLVMVALLRRRRASV
jgi:hypothetical protein